MKTLSPKYFYLAIVLLVAVPETLRSQVPDFSKIPVLHEGDSINISYLVNHGVKISDGKVIAWFPKDSLSENQMRETVKMINKGIRGAEKFINAPLSWQLHSPDDPYTYYFRFDRFVSHASQAGFVSVPFWRIKEGKAPWLHEAIHEMLFTRTGSWFDDSITDQEANEKMPLWLFEGLPDYISLKVSLQENLPWFDVFSNSRQTNIDSLFVKEIGSDKGPYILSFIGRNGVMTELSSTDRILYAPAFYHGSSSFVRYLVDHYNIVFLLTAITSFKKEPETIERLTGKTLAALKKEWMQQLKIGE